MDADVGEGFDLDLLTLPQLAARRRALVESALWWRAQGSRLMVNVCRQWASQCKARLSPAYR